ncbi:MAG: SEC-C metal-binding domain-containing protein [Candidatus Limnocylindrales bacterium]
MGYPSETKVRRGLRVVHGEEKLPRKLGRNDLCPCGSGKRFQSCCLRSGDFDGRERDDCSR